MLSLCNGWEFIPNWFDGFETGEGQGTGQMSGEKNAEFVIQKGVNFFGGVTE